MDAFPGSGFLGCAQVVRGVAGLQLRGRRQRGGPAEASACYSELHFASLLRFPAQENSPEARLARGYGVDQNQAVDPGAGKVPAPGCRGAGRVGVEGADEGQATWPTLDTTKPYGGT